MTDLTAVDVLINPDEATTEHARKLNARMRESVPDGFALNATQGELLAAVTPFCESGGTEAAFVTDADEPDISQSTRGRRHEPWRNSRATASM